MADNKKTAARSVRGGGLDEKKPALKSRFFECGRRERITRIFDAALRAVAKATLSRFARLKPPSEVLILLNSGRKKTCFKKAGFSNVVGERGFEPPTHWSQTSCATKLRYSPNRSACYCRWFRASTPFFNIGADCLEFQRRRCFPAQSALSDSGLAHQLFAGLIPPSGEVYPRQPRIESNNSSWRFSPPTRCWAFKRSNACW